MHCATPGAGVSDSTDRTALGIFDCGDFPCTYATLSLQLLKGRPYRMENSSSGQCIIARASPRRARIERPLELLLRG